MRSDGTRQDEQVIEAFGRITSAIARGHSRDEVIELVASCVRNLVDADLAAVTIRAGPGKLLTIAADGVDADTYRGVMYPAEGTSTEQVLDTGEPVVVTDLSSVPEIGARLPGVLLGPTVFVPITIDGPYGSLSVSRLVGGKPFTAEDLRLSRSFAAQAALVIELDCHRRRQAHAERLADGARIAQELQNLAVREMFAASINVAGLYNDAANPEQRELAGRAIDGIDHAISVIRQVIFSIGERTASTEGDRDVDEMSN